MSPDFREPSLDLEVWEWGEWPVGADQAQVHPALAASCPEPCMPVSTHCVKRRGEVHLPLVLNSKGAEGLPAGLCP